MKYNRLYENWQRYLSESNIHIDDSMLEATIEEVNKFLEGRDVSVLSEEELKNFVNEGLLQKISDKLGVTPLIAAAAISMAMGAGVVKQNDASSKSDTFVDNIENVMDAESDGTAKSNMDYSDAMMDTLEKNGFDTGIKKMGNNVYRGDSKGFIFVAAMDSSSHPDAMKASKELNARAAKEGGKLTAKSTMTSIGGNFYLVKSTK